MPCYSSMQTVLTDLDAIQEAAKSLGITVQKLAEGRYRLLRNGEHITLQRRPGEKKFSTEAYSGSNAWPEAILQPLVQSYAKVKVKQFAAKRGYNASAGTKPGQIVLTSYR